MSKRLQLASNAYVLFAVTVLGVLCMPVGAAQAGVRNATVNPVADSGLYGDTSSGQEVSNRGSGGRFDIGPIQDALVLFDISSQLGPGESVIGATLQLYTARQGYTFALHVVGYPLAASWQEGVGNGGTVGDLAFPWGPASIGDAVYVYQQTTAVGLGTGSFASILVATAGIPWGVAGGRGIGTDVLNRLMIDADWSKPVATEPVGTAFAPLPFTPDGVAVLRGWSAGTIANHGMNIWASTGTSYCASTSREYNGVKPQLILTISLTGDIDASGHVDSADLLLLASGFGKQLGDLGYDPNCDLNGDGRVDVSDLLMLADNFGL